MKNTKLHPDLHTLLNALRELETLLNQQGEPSWATKVGRCADWIEASDAYGLEQFLNLFGGVGSLNDLILFRDDSRLRIENDQLEVLRTKTWELANQLKRTLDDVSGDVP